MQGVDAIGWDIRPATELLRGFLGPEQVDGGRVPVGHLAFAREFRSFPVLVLRVGEQVTDVTEVAMRVVEPNACDDPGADCYDGCAEATTKAVEHRKTAAFKGHMLATEQP
ncbi:hypothetical protein ACFY1L_20760 [Streptomyces sp. NPDC001663]|uniref:hypothetical protein n=1 Tax=Streptomyces sp. NPDC001663 TaxID=3364597 RepID=UPI0036940C55